MKKLRYIAYESPAVEWLVQSPTSNSDLGDITIGGEEGEDEGWLN